MNFNQFGQKKKKQAVRRLSQSSPAVQGNRREDIRKKLEAKRLASSRGNYRRKLHREQPKQGKSFERDSGPFVGRNPEGSGGGVKKHVSPLVNTTSPARSGAASSEMSQPTSNLVSKSTRIPKNPVQETDQKGNVFGNSLFKTSSKQVNVFGGTQFKTTADEHDGAPLLSKSPQKYPPANVFGAFLVPKTQDVSGSENSSGSNASSVNTSSMASNTSNVHPISSSASFGVQSMIEKSDNIFAKSITESSYVGSLEEARSIFTNSQVEKPSTNIFSRGIKPDDNASVNFPTSSTSLFVNKSAESDSQTKGFLSPLSGFDNPDNPNNIFKMATTTSSMNAGNVTETVATFEQKITQSPSNFQPVSSQHGSVFGSAVFSQVYALPPRAGGNVQQQKATQPSPFGNTTVSQGGSIFSLSSNSSETASKKRPYASDLSHVTPTLQNNIFGNAALTPKSDGFSVSSANSVVPGNPTVQGSVLVGAGSFSIRSSPSKIPALATTFSASPTVQSSIFGSSGQAQTTGGFSTTSGVFPVNQRSIGGTPRSSGLPNEGTSLESAGLPTSSSTFSSKNIFGAQNSGPFDETAGKMAQVFPISTVSAKLSTISPLSSAGVFTSGNVEAGKVLSSGKGTSLKGSKRSFSSSSTDLSELTSIVIKGLTDEYFDKTLLTNYLSDFGEVKKVSLQPAKGHAIVVFNSHESAKKAKSRASELFPLEDIGVYWCKRTRTSSGGASSKTFGKTGHETLSESNKKEFRSRKMSIANALRSTDTSTFPLSLTAQERFNVLDGIDKRIRQAIKPYTDLATAPTIVGVCPDMCPEKERYMREDRMNLSIFETLPGTQDNRDDDVQRVDHRRAVKEYSRSAADKLEPLAHEMRPIHVLQMTMDYLAANVMDDGEGRWGEWFNFLWDRTRAIRKDITQQHLCNVECADLVEKITRFHIFCAHYLCEEDMRCFDPKINNENLTKCLQTLKQIYEDLHGDKDIVCSKEPEFQAYDILLNLNEGDTLRKAMQYRAEVRNSSEVKFALEVFSSLNSNNYVRFFKLLKSATYLNACIMHRYFTQVRSRALQTMSKAYRSQEQYPLEGLLVILAFEDKEEAKQFCTHYGFTASNESVQFSKSSFVDPETVYPLRRAENVIENKRKCLIGEVVCGSPLKATSNHEPFNSFDSSGRYVGLSRLILLLGGTDEGVEPSTPDHYCELDISLPSTEQHSAEVEQVARPVDNTQEIFLQAIQDTGRALLEQAVDSSVKDICRDTISETKLKLEVSKVMADKFVSESLVVLLREVASQCIKEEIKVKREKIAIAESRDRVSAVVLREVLNDVLKTEVITLARNTRREIERELKAQSFVKMSAVIMREMTEGIILEQCLEIAFKTRKEIVKERKASLWNLAKTLFKNRQKRYFNRWSKEYHTRLHIRNLLVHMPATPPMLTTEQQLQKLFNEKDTIDRRANTLLSSPSFYSSLYKERAKLQQQLKRMAKAKESQRTKAKEPVDIPGIISELVANDSGCYWSKESSGSKSLKLVISFPGRSLSGSTAILEEIIRCKFSRGAVLQSSSIAPGLSHKIETLSCYTSQTQQVSRNMSRLQVDVKACFGTLLSEESQSVQDGHLFRGLSGIIFVLDSACQVNNEMFWVSSRTRLRQILRSKPRIPSVPLVIINIENVGGDEEGVIEEHLNLKYLISEGLVSHWVVYQQHKPVEPDGLHDQLVGVIQWLACHYPATPSITSENFKSFVENDVLKLFTVPLHEEMALRKRALIQPQCPEVIVELYNAVIDHIISVVTSSKLQDISWPIPEFVSPSTQDPPVSWNSSENFQSLRNILEKLVLPPPPSPAQDGTWKSESKLCLDYVNGLLHREPLYNFGFSLVSSVEKIFNRCQANKRRRSSSGLTAADVPWPLVIETCVNALLSWLQSLSFSATENVYFLEEDTRSFTEPALWRAAVTESLKAAKASGVVRENNKSRNTIQHFTSDVDQELRRLKEVSVHLNTSKSPPVTEEMEQKTQLLYENIGIEKRNCERFEVQLKSYLDGGKEMKVSETGQGIKRKCDPTWTSKPEKTFIQKIGTELGVPLPDFNGTLHNLETSLVTFQDKLELQRHVEEFTEKQLKEALDTAFDTTASVTPK